ncbi:MAG: hypothetical protein ACTH3S_11845 [Marinobacter sp.]|uniref:hypothetical protein n=1 Tax=Marinobacter sp. TaxID=50741 RepID=UPI003F9C5F05
MEIICKSCGHTEETNKDFFVKLIGGAMPVGGYWAWTTYLFAGTGFAMGIVLAIIGGGVAMLIFKDEITEWVISQGYKCTSCGEVSWEPMTESMKQERDFKKYDLGITRTSIETSRSMAKLLDDIMAMDEEEGISPDDRDDPDEKVDYESKVDENLQVIRSAGYDIEPVDSIWLIEVDSGEWVEIESAKELDGIANIASRRSKDS